MKISPLVSSPLPTIYTDMNIYRYISYGDIHIQNPERFNWVFSHVHLNEVFRNGNKDALEGMKMLKAVEINDILNERFESIGNIKLMKYIDPYSRYEQHLEAIKGYENSSDYFIEPLLHSFGSDNFKELSLTPNFLRNEIDKITDKLNSNIKTNILDRANKVADKMHIHIETNFKEKRPIDKTRLALGLNSNTRKKIENSETAIDEIWNIIFSSLPGITKDQFFGFEPIHAIKELQKTQYGTLAGTHMVLNILGINPDKGLANRNQIKNIISDGQHVGMASYCNALLSADKRFCDKANAIYQYAGVSTNTLWFKYEKGIVIKLEINSAT